VYISPISDFDNKTTKEEEKEKKEMQEIGERE